MGAKNDEVYVKFNLAEYQRRGSHKIATRLGDKIAVNLPDLVQQTNQFSVKNRPGCTPSLQTSDPADLFLKYNVKCKLKTSDPAGHEVKVHFDVSKITPEVNAKDLDIKVSCSCPAFLMWGAQWNLHQQDALEGTPRPKLQAPKERLDLRSNFVICKHCKAVMERILPSVQHNISKIVREKDVKDREKAKNAPPPTRTFDPDRLEREQEAMRKRQDIKKQRDKKNKDIQRKMLDSLQKSEEEKLKNKDLLTGVEVPEEDHVVQRDVPVAEAEPITPPGKTPEEDEEEES